MLLLGLLPLGSTSFIIIQNWLFEGEGGPSPRADRVVQSALDMAKKYYFRLPLGCCIASSEQTSWRSLFSLHLPSYVKWLDQIAPTFWPGHTAGQRLDGMCEWTLASRWWFIEMAPRFPMSYFIDSWFRVAQENKRTWKQEHMKTRAFPEATWEYSASCSRKKKVEERQHPHVSGHLYIHLTLKVRLFKKQLYWHKLT